MFGIGLPQFRRFIWVLPAAYALHITEEYLGGFAGWVTHVMGGAMDVPGFLINNAIFMAILVSLTLWASLNPRGWPAFLFVFWASANLFWNFVFHLVTTAALDRYSPGLITAVLLYYPISLATGVIAVKEGVLSGTQFACAAALGAALMGFVIWAGLFHFVL